MKGMCGRICGFQVVFVPEIRSARTRKRRCEPLFGR
jgi:hypothetical protein